MFGSSAVKPKPLLMALETAQKWSCCCIGFFLFSRCCDEHLHCPYSASLGSDVRSQISCTTEYEGDQEAASHGFEKMPHSDSSSKVFQDEPDGFPRRLRLPTPAKARWLKAFHSVKQVIQSPIISRYLLFHSSPSLARDTWHNVL